MTDDVEPPFHTFEQCLTGNYRCERCGKDTGSHYGVLCAPSGQGCRTFLCAWAETWRREREGLWARVRFTEDYESLRYRLDQLEGKA